MPHDELHIHYAAEFSMYSGKTRAYLRYKGIPFEEKLATLWVMKREVIPHTGVAMIPVLKMPDGEFIQDTTDIIDRLEQNYPKRSIYPKTPQQRLATLLLELYGDEWLLIPAMHYRWNFPEENDHFLMGEFGKIVSPWLPGPARRLLGRQVAKRFSSMLPVLGISSQTAPAIESWFELFLGHLNAHFKEMPYLLGERASMADFSFVGPLSAHLGRDPAPRRRMRQAAPEVMKWIDRLNTREPVIGDWAADDQVPESLYPIFRHQFESQFPVLKETVQMVHEWVQEHPDEPIRRKVGAHRFRLGEAEEERFVLSFPQWMLQRPLFYYQSLTGDERAAADQFLDATGGRGAMDMSIPTPVRRENNRLVPDQ